VCRYNWHSAGSLGWQFFILKHTHPFNGPFSGITQVSRYQKGKTNLDFTEARDSEWQWHQLGHMQVCPCSIQIIMPASHHSSFYRPDALPAAQPTIFPVLKYKYIFQIKYTEAIFIKQHSETVMV